MKNILVRADSSSKIGIGHIMRDLVLAEEFKNSNIIFACQNLEGNINKKILDSGLKVEVLKSNNFEELDVLTKSLKIDLLIIDHYGIDYIFEKQLKLQNPRLKILSFDDTCEKHYCDILLNHNICANEDKYKKLVPKNCELRCGKEYTLLREEFHLEKSKKRISYKKGSRLNIFIMFGGADITNMNKKVLKILSKYEKIKVNIVTTKTNKNLNELEDYCKNKKWINLHINSNNVAKLMRKNHFAIVTPSVILNEIFFMDLPFIAIKVASNQVDMYEYIKKNKYLALKEYKKEKLIKAIDKMILNLESN